MYKLAIGIGFGLLLFCNEAMAVCSSYPNTLTNGTTADATQVMANFNCAAFSSGSNMTGASINSLTLTGITTVQSGNTTQLLLNNTTGTKGNNVVFQQNGTNAWTIGQQSGDNSGNFNFFSYGSAGIVLSVNYSSNNVTCGGSCISASDERVKQNIRELTPAIGLTAIRRLVPVSFNWATGDTSAVQFGFVAQEVQKIIPQLVTNSGIKSQRTPDGMLALNYGAMTAPIVLALQELDAKVEKLSATVEGGVQLSVLPERGTTPANVDPAVRPVDFARVLQKQEARINALKAANDNSASELEQLKSQVALLQRKVGVQAARN